MSADQLDMVIEQQNAMAPRFVKQTAAEYHADKTRFSRSQLVDLIESPWLCFKRHVERDPAWQQEESDDMRFGTRFHAVALEGKRFEDSVKLIPEHVLNANGDRMGKEYKLWAALHPDAKEWVKPKELEEDRVKVEQMMESLTNCQAAMDLLTGHPEWNERTIHWDHTGVDLRTRVDRLIPDTCIVDLKTAKSCDLQAINNSLEGDGYYLQAAMYQMAVEAVTGRALPFKFVFVEKVIPFRTVVVELGDEVSRIGREEVRVPWIDRGRAEVEAALARLQRCANTGYWRDPVGDSVITMDRPQWHKYRWQLTEGDDE